MLLAPPRMALVRARRCCNRQQVEVDPSTDRLLPPAPNLGRAASYRQSQCRCNRLRVRLVRDQPRKAHAVGEGDATSASASVCGPGGQASWPAVNMASR